MRSVFSLSALCLTVLSGCADMLGLGGLTYDQGLGETEVSGTGGEGDETPSETGGTFTIPLGGSGSGGSSYVDDDFPQKLARNALIAAAPHEESDSTYWIYDPGQATLAVHRFDWLAPDALSLHSWSSEDDFTRLSAIPSVDGDVTLIGYNRSSGFVSMVHGANGDGEPTRLVDDYGTSGRTHLEPLWIGDEWFAYAYSSGDGSYRYFRPAPSKEPDVFAGMGGSGFDSVGPYSVPGEFSGLAKFDPEEQRLVFERFVELGSPLEQVVEYSASASLMTTFQAGNSWAILLYESGTGLAKTYVLTPGGAGLELIPWDEGIWRGDITRIVPLHTAEQSLAICFSGDSGIATLNDLSQLVDENPIVVR